MNMNKIKYLFIITAALMLSSCNKWLTVDPSDQISEEEITSTADGFHNLTNGLYRQMISADLYGREMTWGFVDVLAQYYDLDNATGACNSYKYGIGVGEMPAPEGDGYDYTYSYTKTDVENIWNGMYNIIANCNNLIAKANEASDDMFEEGNIERKLIIGEATGLRAMLHFDVLRLFAPSVKNDDGKKYIPYVTNFPDIMPEYSTTEEALENIITDLKEAEELTEGRDTLISLATAYTRFEQGGGTSTNRFLRFRGYRLHHYAIKALLARVYMYMGDEVNALAYAKEIIKLHKEDGWFDFTSEYYIENYNNRKMYDDVIFALYDNHLNEAVKEMNPDDEYFMALGDFDGIFAGEEDDDYRALYQWYEKRGWYDSRPPMKIFDTNGLDEGEYNNKMQPMIRLSEMYYIAAECTYDTNKDEAEEYLSLVRKERGVRNALAETNSKAAFVNLILNDFRRELYGEGQLFYFYKRHDLDVLIPYNYYTGKTSLKLGKYFVLPRPDSANV